MEPKDVSPVGKLAGHSKKVGHVLFNPSVENILATSSGDYTVKLWDVETESARLTLRHADIVQSMSWSANGSLMVTTSRDKQLRIWDVRQQEAAQEVAGHSGAKNSRTVWMGEHDRVATTGFSRMSDRQLALWDIRNLKPIDGYYTLDSISGVCMPFWDDGTQCLYLAGKGDGNIRYFEYENDSFVYLSEYQSSEPQRGIGFIPKRGVNLHENEVARAYKTVKDAYIEPISFIVPRRAESFQNDIYPPTAGSRPGLSAAGWFAGEDALPPKIDLKSVYDGEEPVIVAAEFKPAPVSSAPAVSSSAKMEAEPPKSTPVPAAAQRGPQPSIKDSKSSIADVASKFADDDDSGSEEDRGSSSFDRPPKVEGRKTPSPVHAKAPERQREQSPLKHTTTQPPKAEPLPAVSKLPVTGTPYESEEVRESLNQIKSLLELQNRTISAQSEKIGQLTAEVDTLKTKVGESKSDSEKDKRIRDLESELEKIRS
ncbi:MAG: Coronin-like protein crn1 [Trichoglossum hirsutum]|nr:MAG: Coronin-like protein crn1 [Trichoglossum hirsutum]